MRYCTIRKVAMKLPTSLGKLIALILTYVSTGLALDQLDVLTQYGHDAWNEERGLPQSSVSSIVQTPDGYLWLGTQEGLARFDGVKFDVYDKSKTSAMRSNFVSCLLVARDSTLWFGTKGGGFNSYKNGVFKNFSTNDTLPGGSVVSLLQTKDGAIWIGTMGDGLIRYKENQFRKFTREDGLIYLSIFGLCEDRDGTVWVGAPRGLSKYQNGKFTICGAAEGFPGGFVTVIHEDRSGILWIGLENGGLVRNSHGVYTTFSIKDGLSSNSVMSLCDDPQGNLWIGTRGGGINRLTGKVFSSYSSKEGLVSDAVISVFVDREGSLWFGTDGGGLNRFKETKFRAYGKEEGLASDFVMPIVEDSRGDVWVGTSGSGLSRYRDGKFTCFTTKEGLSSNSIHALYAGDQGTLWVGTSGGGLNRYDGRKFVRYDTSAGLSNNFVSSICGGSRGEVWVGTRYGLDCFQGGKWKTFTMENGLSSNFVNCLLPASGGGLWIGTSGGGLDFYDGSKFTNYTRNRLIDDAVIWTMYEDTDGVLWVGTNGHGLYRLKDGKSVAITTSQGLFDDMVFSILEDGSHNLWMSCNKGIFRVSKRDLDAFAGGAIERVTCVSYGKADGMRSRECNGAFQPAACKTRAGEFWFPTIKGAVTVDPEHLKLNPYPPEVSIESAILDQEPVDPARAVELTPEHGTYEFHYTGLSFTAPEFVRFKYKLEGFDADWVDAGFRRSAYYTNLKPGTYTFRVMASNSDGVWSESGASCGFTVLPTFSQTPFFFTLCALGALLVIFGIHSYRLRWVRSRELTLLVDRRTSDLRDEKERSEAAYLSIKSAQEKIREQEALLDKAQEAIFVQGLDGVIQFWNQGAARLYGYPAGTAVGKDAATLLHDEPPELVSKACREVIERGEWRGELQQLTRDKKPLIIESRWSLVRDEETGAPKSVLVINNDVTEEKKMEAQFLRTQRMQSLGTLAGGIAHDLNNVLAPILLSIEVLRIKATDESSLRALQTLEVSAQRGAGIIKQVLAFSRGVEGERGLVELKYVVSELEKIVKDTFPRSIRISTHVPKDLWQVSGDATQLYQVLMNLCVNARDAMPDGGELAIRLENRFLDEFYARTHQDAHSGNYLVMSVSDTGTGIPREVLDKIFEPFFTTKELGKGTGLGLSTAIGILKSHGGFVNVYSEVGHGTKFDVYLPATGAPAEKAAVLHDKMPLPRGNGELVLVVDDEPAIRDINASMLKNYGYEVILAGDGAEAVKMMSAYKGRVKIVITDMMMPVMDGSAAIKRIREIDASIRIVAMSGLMGDQKISEIGDTKNVKFLQKPFTTERLLRTLQETMAHN
jgi:PAS domain S-box-containing protein